MNNQELETKVKEIIAEENFFDMVEKAAEFEKEYKTSDFYNHTKIKFMDILKDAKMFYMFDLNDLFNKLQNKLNSLNLDNINELANKLAETFGQENSEIFEAIDTIKDLKA